MLSIIVDFSATSLVKDDRLESKMLPSLARTKGLNSVDVEGTGLAGLSAFAASPVAFTLLLGCLAFVSNPVRDIRRCNCATNRGDVTMLIGVRMQHILPHAAREAQR